MNYLLDTHVALWWWSDDSQLSIKARELLLDESNVIFFSAISVYEIILKNKIGKLPLADSLRAHLIDVILEEGWKQLPLNLQASHRAGKYNLEHRDPFDRMLAAQAEEHNLTLISADKALKKFPVRVVF